MHPHVYRFELGATFFPEYVRMSISSSSTSSVKTALISSTFGWGEGEILLGCLSSLLFIYSGLLESLCYSLYDTLRPVIIHTNHLETLADLCTIFKVQCRQHTCNSLDIRISKIADIHMYMYNLCTFTLRLKCLKNELNQRVSFFFVFFLYMYMYMHMYRCTW